MWVGNLGPSLISELGRQSESALLARASIYKVYVALPGPAPAHTGTMLMVLPHGGPGAATRGSAGLAQAGRVRSLTDPTHAHAPPVGTTSGLRTTLRAANPTPPNSSAQAAQVHSAHTHVPNTSGVTHGPTHTGTHQPPTTIHLNKHCPAGGRAGGTSHKRVQRQARKVTRRCRTRGDSTRRDIHTLSDCTHT